MLPFQRLRIGHVMLIQRISIPTLRMRDPERETREKSLHPPPNILTREAMAKEAREKSRGADGVRPYH